MTIKGDGKKKKRPEGMSAEEIRISQAKLGLIKLTPEEQERVNEGYGKSYKEKTSEEKGQEKMKQKADEMRQDKFGNVGFRGDPLGRDPSYARVVPSKTDIQLRELDKDVDKWLANPPLYADDPGMQVGRDLITRFSELWDASFKDPNIDKEELKKIRSKIYSEMNKARMMKG